MGEEDTSQICQSVPSGGTRFLVMSQILKDILRYIENIGVFQQNEGFPNPFLLLDGHGSIIEMEWVVCIGVPNGTSLLQVSDSAEQNGCFQMFCS